MDLRLSDEQSQLVATFRGLFAKEATPQRVRDAEPLGFDKALWDRLSDLGTVGMAVAEDAGGSGATLLDVELIAEQYGRAVAPVPLIETQVASRLLARLQTEQAGRTLAAAIAGERVVTLAVRPSVGTVATLVPAAAVADDVLVLDGDDLVLLSPGGSLTPVTNMGCLPLADVPLDGERVVLASGAAAQDAFRVAVAEWQTLTAGALAGLAARALEIGVAYAKERKAFGQPIGSFQGIAHKLAERAAEVDGAQLLAREAAWAQIDDPERFEPLAAMAFGFATETARDTTYNALHFHGGYGFMLEYDIQLYFRRARGWPAVLGEPRTVYRTVGANALATGVI